jgi:ubiquinone biosynthesis protein
VDQYVDEALQRIGVARTEDVESLKFQIQHEVNHLDLVANRVVGGVLIASLLVASALLLSHQVPPRLFGESVFGGLGFFIAAGFGARLLWRIRKDIR